MTNESPMPQTVLRDLPNVLKPHVMAGTLSQARVTTIIEQNVEQYKRVFPIYPISLSGAIQAQASVHASFHTQYEWLSQLDKSTAQPPRDELMELHMQDAYCYAESVQRNITELLIASNSTGPTVQSLMSRNKSQSSRNAAYKLTPWLLSILHEVVDWLDSQPIEYALRPIGHMHRVRLPHTLNHRLVDELLESQVPFNWSQTVMSAFVRHKVTGVTLGVFPSTLPNLLIANAMNRLPLYSTEPIASYWVLDKLQAFSVLGAASLSDPEAVKPLSAPIDDSLIRCGKAVMLVASIVTVALSTLRLGSGIRKPVWLHTPMNHVNVKLLGAIWQSIQEADSVHKSQGELI